MALSPADRQKAADMLLEAERTKKPVLQLSTQWPNIEIEDSYAIAGLVTGDSQAYVYLNESIELFPGRHELSREIAAAGFTQVRAMSLTGGIVALHCATR